MSFPIIGVGGRMQSGKDTASDYLVEHYGYVKQGMSDSLLKYALIIDPWIRADITFWGTATAPPVYPGDIMKFSRLVSYYGYTKAKEQTEVRRFLQKLGTEVGRDIDENLWVNKARERALEAAENNPVILTGIRFPNEIEMIRNLWGSSSLYIYRDAVEHEPADHDSENSVSQDDFDTVITNNSTLDDLYSALERFQEYIEVRPSRI